MSDYKTYDRTLKAYGRILKPVLENSKPIFVEIQT